MVWVKNMTLTLDPQGRLFLPELHLPLLHQYHATLGKEYLRRSQVWGWHAGFVTQQAPDGLLQQPSRELLGSSRSHGFVCHSPGNNKKKKGLR